MELKQKDNTVRILVKGGVLSPSYLMKILKIAGMAGNNTIGFGSRQDVIFGLPNTNQTAILHELDQLKIEYIVESQEGPKRQNIVSSFVSADIQESTQWLNSGNYLQILDLFTYPHRLRINITDPLQSMVPLFYGHINFVASPHKHYWYLQLRLPGSVRYMWPMLIYTTDIPSISKAIEELWTQNNEMPAEEMAQELLVSTNLNHKKIDRPLQHTQSFSADYEGYGRMYESNKYWAGFYWRNNRYDNVFLEELCRFSLKTGIAKVAITPWKSLMIKDIAEKELVNWHGMLGRFGITMRHSAFDLNWHLPLGSTNALKLKQFIVRQFDKQDVCVHGLTFGVTYGREIPFCSIMIHEKPHNGLLKYLPINKKYDVWVADNFDPNSCEYSVFEADCSKRSLPETLNRATRLFYRQFTPGYSEKPHVEQTMPQKLLAYQCPNCQTVYRPEQGSPDLGIHPGTAFQRLPDSYCCPLCETEKHRFKEVDLSKLKIA